MASTYSSDTKLELITTGEKAGQWGGITNTNLQILEQVASGVLDVDMASGDVTLALTDGATSNGKNQYFSTSGGFSDIKPEGVQLLLETIEKSDDTFRIIAVGGSTTEGISKNDNETYPGFLQTLFEINDIKNVEVINAGVSGAASFEERNLIENKLMKYNPDLIIIYD